MPKQGDLEAADWNRLGQGEQAPALDELHHRGCQPSHRRGFDAEWLLFKLFWHNIIPYKSESVHFFGLMNSTTKVVLGQSLKPDGSSPQVLLDRAAMARKLLQEGAVMKCGVWWRSRKRGSYRGLDVCEGPGKRGHSGGSYNY